MKNNLFKIILQNLVLSAIFIIISICFAEEPITVSIEAINHDIYAGSTVAFKANLTNTDIQTVIWTASDGIIDSKGVFYAPSYESKIIITATSIIDPTKSDSVEIKIKVVKEEWSNDFSIQSGFSLSPSSPDFFQKAIATDNQANLYITGNIYGNSDDSNHGLLDGFLVKYDEDGQKLWELDISSDGLDRVSALELDSAGNIYLIGESSGAIFTHSFVSEDGPDPYTNPFIVKYDSDGNELWHKWIFSDFSAFYSLNLAVANDNSVIITAQIYSSFDGDNNLILKYDASGNIIWQKKENTEIIHLVVDDDSNFYTITQDKQIARLSKFDSNGNELWQTAIEYGSAQALTSESNTIIIAGGLYESDDIYIAKYSTNGKKLWLQQFESLNPISVGDLITDTDGNIYLAGQSGNTDWNNSEIEDKDDIYILKYNSKGKEIWHKWLNTDLFYFARALAVDKHNNLYLAGDSGGKYFELTKYSIAFTKSMLIKYKQ